MHLKNCKHDSQVYRDTLQEFWECSANVKAGPAIQMRFPGFLPNEILQFEISGALLRNVNARRFGCDKAN